MWQFREKTYGLFYITSVPTWWLSAQAVKEFIDFKLKSAVKTLMYYRTNCRVFIITVFNSNGERVKGGGAKSAQSNAGAVLAFVPS